MKYKLLAVSKFPNISGVNIGDYVQALAASQFIPHLDGFVDRDEELKDYDGAPCNVIMNGWYMHRPRNWPPSNLITPLFLSFHVNSSAKADLLSPVSVAYLKSHEPIGCRDLETMNSLKSKGVDAYFSGCLTLTLGERYGSSKNDGGTYIVDPYINCRFGWYSFAESICTIFKHPSDIRALLANRQLRLHHGRNFFKKVIKTVRYYNEYCRVFSRELVMGSTYISQEGLEYLEDYDSDRLRLDEARRLIDLYAEASLVISSRIHCALPCLGLETPVIYLEKVQDIEESKCRLAGLKDLLNIVKVDNGTLVPQFETALPITASNHPPNKEHWKSFASDLRQRCEDFVKNSENLK